MQTFINILNSSFFLAVVTIVVGAFAIWSYLHGKEDSKRAAVTLILQEIRQAESHVKNYRHATGFNFYQRLLPSDNWNQNIHFFVKDLEENELDAINTFYAKAQHIDWLIQVIENQRFMPTLIQAPFFLNQTSNINVAQPQQNQINMPFAQSQNVTPVPPIGVSPLSNGNAENQLMALADELKRELLYNTPIGIKLKKLSNQKRWGII